MARTSTYDEEKAERVVKFVAAGANRADAAMAAGVPERTLYRWMEKNATFRQRVMEADASAVITAENLLKKKNPLAYLQAKRPLIYGNLGKTSVEITGRDGGPVEIEHGISDSAILTFADYLRDRPEDSSGSG